MIDTLPAGLTVRPPTLDDVKATTDLIRLCETTLYGESDVTESGQAAAWREMGDILKDGAQLVFASNGQLIAYARVRNVANVLFYGFLRVHPDYEKTGVDAYLLSRMEAYTRSLIPLAPQDARIVMNFWKGDTHTSLRDLLERHGFSIARSTNRMEIKLEQEPPALELPDSIIIRSFERGQDERATFEANDEAFRDHWGHVPGNFEEWQRWAVEREDFDPSLYFLACEGDQIAGVSLCQLKTGTGWVDDLSVRRPWRRKGVGAALLQHTFREFYRRGISTVALDVDTQNLTGATRLYQRAGMRPVRRYDTYMKEIRPGIEQSTQSLTS